ncbi:hypothetical protein M5689_002256 [Euphorbia peplus]|nr:hypothetical protein M5689_002256 [Euphorbia peplus]
MAEIYLGKLLSNLINSTPYNFQELQAFWGFGDEFELLWRSLYTVADLVETLEELQDELDSVRMWLREMKEVAYEADDLLSELSYEATRLKNQSLEVCGMQYEFIVSELE